MVQRLYSNELMEVYGSLDNLKQEYIEFCDEIETIPSIETFERDAYNYFYQTNLAQFDEFQQLLGDFCDANFNGRMVILVGVKGEYSKKIEGSTIGNDYEIIYEKTNDNCYYSFYNYEKDLVLRVQDSNEICFYTMRFITEAGKRFIKYFEGDRKSLHSALFFNPVFSEKLFDKIDFDSDDTETNGSEVKI